MRLDANELGLEASTAWSLSLDQGWDDTDTETETETETIPRQNWVYPQFDNVSADFRQDGFHG
jgi:hypothetical protein